MNNRKFNVLMMFIEEIKATVLQKKLLFVSKYEMSIFYLN
jgi:hypothetical protein